jgi:hypothetical protein
MAVPEILAGILLVGLVVKFKRKTPIYWVLVILGTYGVFKYFNRFEHLTGEAKTKRMAEIEKDITYLKSVGITESSENEAMKRLLAERDRINPPTPAQIKAKRMAEIEKDIRYLKSVGITEESDNETMKKLLVERDSLNPPSPEQIKAKRLAQIEKDITYLKSVGLTETSDNETMKRLVAERTGLTTASLVSLGGPAPAAAPEKPIPWSLCSIEKRGVL